MRSLANVFHNSTGHFWDVSEHIMDRIENPSYLAGRPAFRENLINLIHGLPRRKRLILSRVNNFDFKRYFKGSLFWNLFHSKISF